MPEMTPDHIFAVTIAQRNGTLFVVTNKQIVGNFGKDIPSSSWRVTPPVVPVLAESWFSPDGKEGRLGKGRLETKVVLGLHLLESRVEPGVGRLEGTWWRGRLKAVLHLQAKQDMNR